MRISSAYVRVMIVLILMASMPVAGSAAPAKAAPSKATPAKGASAKKNDAIRVWTTVSGNEAKGEYVEKKYGRVTLRTPEGKLLMIAERSLSAKDQAWIKAYEKSKNAPSGIKKPTKPNVLPVFKGGENSGYHAVYKSPNFDACMNAGGAVLVFPKEGGSRTGKRIVLRLACYYHDSDKRMRGRGVVSYSSPSPPKAQATSVSLQGMLKDDVSFSVSYEFSDKGVRCYGYCRDPKDIEYKTTYRIMAGVPASHTFDLQFPMDKRKEILEGWQIVVVPFSGKSKTYTYWESVHGFSGSAKKVMVDSPLFGKRRISFTPGKPDKAPIIPWIYSGNAMYQGFAVQLIKRENDSRSKGEYMMLRID